MIESVKERLHHTVGDLARRLRHHMQGRLWLIPERDVHRQSGHNGEDLDEPLAGHDLNDVPVSIEDPKDCDGDRRNNEHETDHAQGV